MKLSNRGPVRAQRRDIKRPDKTCPPRSQTRRITFRPVKARRGRIIAAGRKGDRFRVNLTPELLWQDADYRIEIKREAHPR